MSEPQDNLTPSISVGQGGMKCADAIDLLAGNKEIRDMINQLS